MCEDKDKVQEEATQSSMVDGGKIGVFGEPDNNFSYKDWFEQLFELKDYEN